MTGSGRGVVEEVCVVHSLVQGTWGLTAIEKEPLAGKVWVDRLGLAGDRQESRGHGGPDMAVYVYAAEDAEWWSQQLGRRCPAGCFGENLRIRGIDITDARIGQCWRVGEVELEVRMPRTPCANLSRHLGIADLHKQFAKSGRVGAMCRVRTEGNIAADDAITCWQPPTHDVTTGQLATQVDPLDARRLLQSDTPLARSVRRRVLRAAGMVTGRDPDHG